MALYLGNTKIAGSGAIAPDIPDAYKTYAETSAQLSNDGYATQGWVQAQDFGGGISLSDVQATIFDFGNGDLSAFGWEGEITYQNLVDAGIKSDQTTVIKQPVCVRVGNRVAGIGNSTFDNCSSLTNVTIPGNVTSIGDSAFFYCLDLTSVTIPNNVTSIGNYAFEFCESLSGVTIPNNVTSIGYCAFTRCSSLTSVTIPDSVTSIGNDTFYYCASLSSVTIGKGMTSIGERTFLGCNSLSEIKVEGKTHAEAEALLANASVPAGCQIKTWSFVPPVYAFTKETSVAKQPRQTSANFQSCEFDTQVDGWYKFVTDGTNGGAPTNGLMLSIVNISVNRISLPEGLCYNAAGTYWEAIYYIKAGCHLTLDAFLSTTLDNNSSGLREIFLLT